LESSAGHQAWPSTTRLIPSTIDDDHVGDDEVSHESDGQ
jgi:hypothetical protein